MSEIIDGWNKKYKTEALPETLYESVGNGVVSNAPARPIIGYDGAQFSNGVSGAITFTRDWGTTRSEPTTRMGENGRQEIFVNGRWWDVGSYYV